MAGDPAVPALDSAFDVVRRGYDQDQVEDHLRRLDAEIRIMTADRAAAMDQAAQLTRELDDSRARTDRLRVQVRTLVTPPQNVQGMSERMESMLRMAEAEVSEMLSEAAAEIAKRDREAELRVARILADAHTAADAERAAARAETEAMTRECAHARQVLDAERRTAADAIEEAATAAKQERDQAWADAEARRALIRDDFAIAMNQRRSEALAALVAERAEASRQADELRDTAAAQAQQSRDEAHAAARRILADAENHIGELTALRGRIVEQLRGARLALGRTLGDLVPLPEETMGDAGVAPPPAPAERFL